MSKIFDCESIVRIEQLYQIKSHIKNGTEDYIFDSNEFSYYPDDHVKQYHERCSWPINHP